MPIKDTKVGGVILPSKADADQGDYPSQSHPEDGVARDLSRGATRKMPTPSPDTRKFAGAGPAMAEHSKDAKAPKSGRQPGAYKKT